MRLSARLARLQGEAGIAEPRPIKADSDLRQRLARIEKRRPSASCSKTRQAEQEETLAKQLKGHPISDGLIRIYRRIPLLGAVGRFSLSLLQQPPRLPGDRMHAYARQVYVDTETTGLCGGSGTLAFLIGMAWVEHDTLLITQYLITRFTAEGTMLDLFADSLNAKDRLVSYNGKCYDLPLLKTRYRMQRRPDCLASLPHLDLLHPVRRLFSSTWPDCRLLTLEQRLLGFKRHNDLPGSAAPEAWFDFVRSGRTAQLVRVVEHNYQDILTLAISHAALTQVIAQPECHGTDIVALARWLVDSEETAAYTLLKRQLQTLPNSGQRLLGRLARRHGDWKLAVEIWERLAKRGCLSSTEQLAKYHEHINKDLKIAKYYCEQLPVDDEQQRRLNRIVNKLHYQTLQPALYESPVR